MYVNNVGFGRRGGGYVNHMRYTMFARRLDRVAIQELIQYYNCDISPVVRLAIKDIR